MADNASLDKKFGYRPGSSKNSPKSNASPFGDSSRTDTPAQARPGVPQLGLHAVSPTAPVLSSYPSGSRTQRDAGSTVQRRTSEGQSVTTIGFARFNNAAVMHAGDAPTTLSSTSADSTRASNESGEPSSASVAHKAESLQSTLPMTAPIALPPLPLPTTARLAPSDVPSRPSAKPESAQMAAHQFAATQPAYADELASPRSAEGKRTIRQVASDILPESSGAALVTMSAGEDRFSKVRTSRKSPSGSGRAYARSPGRHSAPVMPQGGTFKKLMDQEKKAVHAETLAPASPSPQAPVDPKVRREAAIDKFKSSHAADFGDEDFAIAFNLALQQWKRDNREPDIAAVPAAMKGLYLQVKKNAAEREKLERDGPPVQSPPRKMKTGSSQGASKPASASSSTSMPRSSPPQSPGKRLLDEERFALLKNFLKVDKREASLERYPDLRRRVEAEALAWVEQQSGGSFGLALKKIFEQELVRCFYQSGRVISDAPSTSLKELKEAVRSWKDLNRGEILTLDVLWQIAPKVFEPLTLDRTRKNAQFLHKEFLTEAFLKRDEVFAELKVNRGVKKKFLSEVRHWILDGGSSQNPKGTVQQLYHDALTVHYQTGLEAAGAQAVHLRSLSIAAMTWWEDNEASVLTTAVLDTLYAAIRNGE